MKRLSPEELLPVLTRFQAVARKAAGHQIPLLSGATFHLGHNVIQRG
jgi:hypothetical protein